MGGGASWEQQVEEKRGTERKMRRGADCNEASPGMKSVVGSAAAVPPAAKQMGQSEWGSKVGRVGPTHTDAGTCSPHLGSQKINNKPDSSGKC